MFIKIRSLLNEKADRWADEGGEDIDNVPSDGMGLAYNLLSRGLRKESNSDAP